MSKTFVRQSFLNAHCADCGGKVYRFLYLDRVSDGDLGNEIVRTHLEDVCANSACPSKVKQTMTSSIDCNSRMTPIFDEWDKGAFNRETFDNNVNDALSRAPSRRSQAT